MKKDNLFHNIFRIEICGGIAAGKTTLATLLKENGVCAVFENFSANPFWMAFYKDPGAFAFETEITFLLQHYHQALLETKKHNNLVLDYSLALDLSYADVTLDKGAMEAFRAVYGEVIKRINYPSLLIYLECDPQTELDRIHRRARPIEQEITIEYLTSLNSAINKNVFNFSKKCQVISVNSALYDFAYDKDIQRNLISQIQKIMDNKIRGMNEAQHNVKSSSKFTSILIYQPTDLITG